jgi:hypothetical protein
VIYPLWLPSHILYIPPNVLCIRDMGRLGGRVSRSAGAYGRMCGPPSPLKGLWNVAGRWWRWASTVRPSLTSPSLVAAGRRLSKNVFASILIRVFPAQPRVHGRASSWRTTVGVLQNEFFAARPAHGPVPVPCTGWLEGSPTPTSCVLLRYFSVGSSRHQSQWQYHASTPKLYFL